MAPPPWIWIIVAWLLARDTKLYNKLSFVKKSPQPLTKSSPKSLPKSEEGGKTRRSWTTSLSITLNFVLAGTLLLWAFSAEDPPQQHNEPAFTLHPTSFSPPLEDESASSPALDDTSIPDLSRIQNTTLGFSRIFVINLPSRSDKRDAMTLASALTNLSLTWTSAVRGIDVPDKALPIGITRTGWHDGGIGSWRSQMNVIRTIVEENLASALILEDDADWDVRVKDQLENIAQGTRVLLDLAVEEDAFAAASSPVDRASPMGSVPHSPYGDGWDMLWLGHCGETFPERIPGHSTFIPGSARYTYYAMNEDETLPARPDDAESWISGDLKRHPGTRWVHFSGSPTCSAAYAVSQAGARKLLHALGGGSGTLDEQLDNAMATMCRDHTPWDEGNEMDDKGPMGYKGARMRCLSVTPAVFSQHKPRGRMDAGSDIETVEGGEMVREKGESPNLVWSARLNVQNLMNGREMEEQVPGWRPGIDRGG